MTTYSYNGWSASRDRDVIHVVPLTVCGVEIVGGVKAGDVHTVFTHLLTEWHARVEIMRNPGCWGYSYRKNRNANNLSCHASGTAVDINAPRHPNGKRGTFTAGKVRTIHALLAEYDGLIRWGGDFHGTPDEMHLEVNGNAAQIATLAARLGTPPPAQVKPKPHTSPEDDMTFIAIDDKAGQAWLVNPWLSTRRAIPSGQLKLLQTAGLRIVRGADVTAASLKPYKVAA